LFVCLDIFRVCTFILGIGFACQDESCPPSFSHLYKYTSRTEMSLLSSEQEDILLVACNLFHLIELFSQVYSEQEVLLTPLQVGLVLIYFLFNPSGDHFYYINTFMTCGLMQKLLGSSLFSKRRIYIILHNFSLLLRLSC